MPLKYVKVHFYVLSFFRNTVINTAMVLYTYSRNKKYELMHYLICVA